MPKAKNRVERGWQVFNYLKATWPSTTHPVDMHFVPEMEPDEDTGQQAFAEVGWDGKRRRLAIRINLKRCRDTGVLVESLVHEYAHCMDRWDYRSNDHPDHFPTWGIWYGLLYHDFYDDGGWDRSQEYATHGL